MTKNSIKLVLDRNKQQRIYKKKELSYEIRHQKHKRYSSSKWKLDVQSLKSRGRRGLNKKRKKQKAMQKFSKILKSRNISKGRSRRSLLRNLLLKAGKSAKEKLRRTRYTRNRRFLHDLDVLNQKYTLNDIWGFGVLGFWGFGGL